MTPATLARPSIDIRSLYAPIERAAIARYLEREDPHPQDLAGLDPTSPVDPDEWDETTGGLAPLFSETGSYAFVVENVVARICLEAVSLRLPQWAVVSDEGVQFARKHPRRRTRRRLISRHLFTINWADGGPGFSWPEAYRLTWLTGYDVAVVTASADCPDMHGYSDYAIGWFDAGTSEEDGVRRCITEWWSTMRSYGQERWAYLFDTGHVSAGQAAAWANRVWGTGER
jgi:hypothetical protein